MHRCAVSISVQSVPNKEEWQAAMLAVPLPRWLSYCHAGCHTAMLAVPLPCWLSHYPLIVGLPSLLQAQAGHKGRAPKPKREAVQLEGLLNIMAVLEAAEVTPLSCVHVDAPSTFIPAHTSAACLAWHELSFSQHHMHPHCCSCIHKSAAACCDGPNTFARTGCEGAMPIRGYVGAALGRVGLLAASCDTRAQRDWVRPAVMLHHCHFAG